MSFDFRSGLGQEMKVGHIIGFRFWRYTYEPLILRSWVANMLWKPKEYVEAIGDLDDDGGLSGLSPGIHAYKTMEDLTESVRGNPEYLVMRSTMTEHDGIVVGAVGLWGIVWTHAKGYRAQFAKPLSFMAAYGKMYEDVLPLLKKEFALSNETGL